MRFEPLYVWRPKTFSHRTRLVFAIHCGLSTGVSTSNLFTYQLENPTLSRTTLVAKIPMVFIAVPDVQSSSRKGERLMFTFAKNIAGALTVMFWSPDCGLWVGGHARVETITRGVAELDSVRPKNRV